MSAPGPSSSCRGSRRPRRGRHSRPRRGRGRPHRRPRRLCRDHGRIGLGQVDPHEHHRLPRRADPRAVPAGRRRRTDTGRAPAAVIRNRKIGFIFQSFNLIPRTNALDNVALPIAYARVRPASAGPRTGGAGRGRARRPYDHLPTELSGGQQQRVAVARAHRHRTGAPARGRANRCAGHPRVRGGARPVRPPHRTRTDHRADHPRGRCRRARQARRADARRPVVSDQRQVPRGRATAHHWRGGLMNVCVRALGSPAGSHRQQDPVDADHPGHPDRRRRRDHPGRGRHRIEPR